MAGKSEGPGGRGRRDGVTVTPDMVKSNELKLAFPAGASDSQVAAYQKVVSYGEQYGIKVTLYAVSG